MNLSKALWYLSTKIKKTFYGHIGKHSYIGKCLYVQKHKNIFIGDNVRIYPGMRAELIKETAKITIGNNVSIGQNFHIVSYDSDLKIGDNVTISANVFISNVDHDYHEKDISSIEQNLLKKETYIDDYCFIGYGAVILPGTKLGKQCIIGANSVIRGVFSDYCVIVGAPGKIVKKYNIETKKWEKV